MDPDALKAALASRKKYVDATASTQSEGTATALRHQPAPLEELGDKMQFYSGDFLDKAASGHVGLLNQGATCYLNSLFQALFQTPEFRQGVYQYHVTSEDAAIVVQLQRLFARLQVTARGATSTAALTKSFGWDYSEVYQQQDVQELFHIVFEHLQTLCAGSELGELIQTGFHGSVLDVLECQTCKHARERGDSFLDLSLNVKGMFNLENAFEDYIKPEELTGSDAVNCVHCKSKQPSTKGLRLQSLPYILSIQLKRFTMDWERGIRVKLDDAMMYPRTIDLSRFVSNNNNNTENQQQQQQPLVYELYAILMHTGGALGGHYFAYIKDFKHNQWYNFNDSNVIPLSEAEVASMFGEEPTKPTSSNTEAKEEGKAAADVDEQTPAANTTDISSPPPLLNEQVEEVPEGPPMAPGFDDAPLPPPGPPSAPSLSSSVTTNKKAPAKKWGAVQAAADSENSRIFGGFVPPAKNAYMLIYRLKDETKNVNEVPESLIPPELVKEIEAEDAVYLVQKQEWDRQRSLTTLLIHHNDEVHKLQLSKTLTIGEATRKAYELLQLASLDVAFERVRLRALNVLKGIPQEPFVDMNKTLDAYDFTGNKAVIMEICPLNGEFEEWNKNSLTLKLMILNKETNNIESGPLVSVNLSKEKEKETTAAAAAVNVKRLKEVISKKLGWDKSVTKLVWLTGDKAQVLNDESVLLSKYRLLDGDRIHVEQSKEEEESLIVNKHYAYLSRAVLYFNDPNNAKQTSTNIADTSTTATTTTNNNNMHQVTVDIRHSLLILKQLISEQIHVPINQFKLRAREKGMEFKNLNENLAFYGLADGDSVYVEKGIPLLPDQYVFQVFIIVDPPLNETKAQQQQQEAEDFSDAPEAPPPPPDAPLGPPPEVPFGPSPALEGGEVATCATEEDSVIPPVKLHFESIGEAILSASWTLEQVKNELARLPGAPPVDLMRLREKSPMGNLTKVYYDSRTLGENVEGGMRDGRNIILQQTTRKEVLSPEHVLLNLRWWHPQQGVLDPPSELAFLQTCTLSQLKEQLMTLYSIPVSVAKPFIWKIQAGDMSGMEWEAKLSGDTVLTDAPWRLRNGSCLVFKDSREEEKPVTSTTTSFTKVEPVQHHEPVLKIWTMQEQREREQARAAVREQRDKEQVPVEAEDARQKRLMEQQTRSLQGL